MRFWKKAFGTRIQSQPTPNPNSLKFTASGERFLEQGLLAFRSSEEAATHPLAAALFSIEGVTNVLILPEFVTITRRADVPWETIEEAVITILSRYLDGQL
jgi:hypothetical protein